MKSTVSAFIGGSLFALGLILSEMVNPQRVRDFLDVTGNWDPRLIFVMIGAIVIVSIGYKLIFRRDKPLFENVFNVPTNTEIDKRVLMGAVLFGAGWGLSGLCPGPAIVGLATFKFEIVVFVIAMIVGMKGFELLKLD